MLLTACCVFLFAMMNSVSFAQDKVNFETDIKPLFEKHCIRCHGPDDQEGSFRIDARDSVFDYIEVGDSDFSDLYDYYIATEDEENMMPPPNEGGPMHEDEILLVKNWIDQGAEWPEDVKLELVKEVVEQVEEQVAAEEKARDAQQDNLKLVTEVTGLLHPLVLHFPVALLMGGALFALFGFRGESPLADAAYYCLWLGAITAIFACVSGWYFAVDKNMTDWQSLDFDKSIDVHRWGGIVIAALAFLLALIAASSRRRDPYGVGAMWKLGLIVLAGLTGYVAHHGGKMTHDGLHDKLFNKSTQLYENLTGDKKAEPAKDPDEDGEASAATSDEESPEKTQDDSSDKSKDADNKEAEGENDGKSGDNESQPAAADDDKSQDDKSEDDDGKEGDQ